ncbi:MAG: methionine--tRNA ligase [Candidatus Erginobacter occultus]|nr:methionine--tRNA ligase [Candidatus Erginobacter occultus]
MSGKFYITTPIYYVNDQPHIGHAYTTIAADVLARGQRAAGRDVRFLTGTDEHGIKICQAAARAGLNPGELADRVVVHFRDLWKRLDIRYDDFIRTSQDRHRARVGELVRRLLDRDQIYLGAYDGWYDEGQEEYVTENDARENDYLSPISGRPLVRHSEESYFFRLSRWIEPLAAHIESHPEFIQPASRRNEVISKLKLGVEDLSISRQAAKLMNWGVPMPNDPACSVYVWIDALSNYITALGYPPLGDGQEDLFASYWPADIHLIGKDILWFHAVYWPCLLLALDLPLPVTVFAHGWWLHGGKKMSKSLGNFISREEIEDICRDYSPDYLRYFLLRSVKFGDDGNFSSGQLKEIYNTELANGVGNLLSRTVKMVEKYLSGTIPRPPSAGKSGEEEVIGRARDLIESFPGWMARLEFQSYLGAIVDLETAANRYIEENKPYALAREDPASPRLAEILATCAEAVRIILLYLLPVMPEKAAQGLEMLGVEVPDQGATVYPARWGGYDWSRTVKKGKPLFPRRD